MTGKHRRAGIIATVGFLSVVTAVSAAAATIPSGAPGKAEMVGRSSATTSAVTLSAAQGDINYQKARVGAVALADKVQVAEARARAARAAARLRAHRIHDRRVKAVELAAAAAAAERAAAVRAAAELRAHRIHERRVQAASLAAASAAADRRAAAARARREAQSQSSSSSGGGSGYVASGNPEQIAQGMLSQYGWSSSQFSCLYPLWQRESGWSVSADNPSSGAFGIPQALPGSKMASAGSDWQTNAATQIRWGLQYIQSVYGSPCGAWSHEQSAGWY